MGQTLKQKAYKRKKAAREARMRKKSGAAENKMSKYGVEAKFDEQADFGLISEMDDPSTAIDEPKTPFQTEDY